MAELVDVSLIGDYLTLGGVGFVFGCAIPLAGRLIAYIIDGALLFTR